MKEQDNKDNHVKTVNDIHKKASFTVQVTLSSFEASLIHKLRQHPYGTFEIIKQGGEPRRVKIIGSELLEESEAYALQVEELKKHNANIQQTTREES